MFPKREDFLEVMVRLGPFGGLLELDGSGRGWLAALIEPVGGGERFLAGEQSAQAGQKGAGGHRFQGGAVEDGEGAGQQIALSRR